MLRRNNKKNIQDRVLGRLLSFLKKGKAVQNYHLFRENNAMKTGHIKWVNVCYSQSAYFQCPMRTVSSIWVGFSASFRAVFANRNLHWDFRAKLAKQILKKTSNESKKLASECLFEKNNTLCRCCTETSLSSYYTNCRNLHTKLTLDSQYDAKVK